MSIFRKRSGSQSSFSYGADEISVSKKIVPDVMTKECRSDTVQSTRSSCSDIDASDFAIHESCVVRNFPKHKSSHLRFLAWVAYTRKYTDEWITDIERRTCPLLWCREQFADQDAMLKHVWNCPHLSKGLYWCFHCQKPERVGKFQCKRCQGVPSRTDRMASVAKKIFSKLGSKANRSDHYAHPEGGRSWANFQSSETSKSDQKGSKSFDEKMDWDHQYIQELPNTSICPEMPGDWAAASHELPDSYISEMIGTELPIEMGMSNEGMDAESWNENFYAASLEDWEMPPPPVPKKNISPKPATLRVDTSFSSLTASMYQGRIPQRTSSARWPDTPLSPAIISPLSAGPVFSAGSSALEVSPTDSDTSGNSFFTDSGYSSATTTISAWNMPVMCEQLATFEDKKGKKRAREEDEPVFEDWIHDSAFDGQIVLTAEATSMANNMHQEVTVSDLPNVSLELAHSSPADCGLGDKPRIFTAHWCDAPTLVHSFSEALDVHIEHTKSALRELPSTSITQELLAMSKTSMVSIGLEVLAGILEGRKPTAIVQVFAFTHIACAFVITTEQDEGKVVGDAWFGDVLRWVEELGSVKQRGLYGQIVKVIWKPFGSSHMEQSQLQRSASSSSSSSSSSDRQNALDVRSENSLFAGCKHFLDVLGSYNASEVKPGYMADISLIKELLPEESYSDEEGEESHNHGHVPFLKMHGQNAFFDGGFDAGYLYGSDEASFERFMQEADSVLQQSLSRHTSSASSHASQGSISRQTSNSSSHSYQPHPASASQHLLSTHQNSSTPSLVLTQPSPPAPISRCLSTHHTLSQVPHHERFEKDENSISKFHQVSHIHNQTQVFNPPSQSPAPALSARPPPSPSNFNPAVTSTQASSSTCPLCGYSPSGEERWKASNLRRHKRTQHPELLSGGNGKAKLYPCRFPGCEKKFRRSDNLRGHQRDKGHGAVVGMTVRAGESDLDGDIDGERSGKKRRMTHGIGKR